jgi:hypothetical protein
VEVVVLRIEALAVVVVDLELALDLLLQRQVN